MIMKKFITDIKTLAALLMAGAAFTACSSDDNTIDEQPVNPAKQTYTLTVKASKGGDATTRALTLTGEGNKTLKAYWDGTETVTVKEGDTPLGTLTVTPDATDNTQATLSGELDAAPSGTALTLELFSDAYNSQDGTLDYIASHCDYATATTTVTYDAVNKTVTGTDADFTNQQAIIKFMLKDKGNSDASISPSALTVTDGTSTVNLTGIPTATYTTNGDGVLYVAFPAAGSAKTITLTATVGDDTYTYETATTKTFTNGQYYDITVKMMKMKKLGKFSVSSTKQVYFSLGNLQATNATANSEDGWVWSFAEHQYDIIGNATANNAVGNNVVTTAGTVDLFGWVGVTSDSELAPYGINNNENRPDYCYSTTDVLKSDWGTLPIVNGGNKANSGWRTPSCAEWEYVLTGRTDAASKVGFATVGGQNGIIILPDEFTDPMKNGGSGAFVPKATTGYGANVYTAGGDWEAMEANGAVFLPSAGGRLGTTVTVDGDSRIPYTDNSHGGYWSSTCTYGGGYNRPDYTRACYVKLFSNAVSVGTGTNTQQRYGLSVRLVRDVE